MTRQHRAGEYPTTGMPHISPTGAKASGCTVEDCSKACREVRSRARRKEVLEGGDGKMVGGHQIDNSSLPHCCISHPPPSPPQTTSPASPSSRGPPEEQMYTLLPVSLLSPWETRRTLFSSGGSTTLTSLVLVQEEHHSVSLGQLEEFSKSGSLAKRHLRRWSSSGVASMELVAMSSSSPYRSSKDLLK